MRRLPPEQSNLATELGLSKGQQQPCHGRGLTFWITRLGRQKCKTLVRERDQQRSMEEAARRSRPASLKAGWVPLARIEVGAARSYSGQIGMPTKVASRSRRSVEMSALSCPATGRALTCFACSQGHLGGLTGSGFGWLESSPGGASVWQHDFVAFFAGGGLGSDA